MRSTRSAVASSVATAARTLPDTTRDPSRMARRALRTTARASAAARSAIPARSALIAATSSLAACVRRRRFAAMSRARDRTDRVRSRVAVRDANPASLIRRTVAASFATPLASNPESVGYATLASTTVVSARTRVTLRTFAAAALANNASFSPSTASVPQRVVIFINVVGCGTDAPSGIRANRCQLIESATSRHNGSNPSR
jgi:hypothetical protein